METGSQILSVTTSLLPGTLYQATFPCFVSGKKVFQEHE